MVMKMDNDDRMILDNIDEFLNDEGQIVRTFLYYKIFLFYIFILQLGS